MSIKKHLVMLMMSLSLLLLWAYAYPATATLFEAESFTLSALSPYNIARAAGPEPLMIQPEADDPLANQPPIAPHPQIWAQSMVVIPASADAFLSAAPGEEDFNTGGATDFAAGRDGNGDLRRGVIKFNIASSGIPAGANILSATLTLNVVRWPAVPGPNTFFQIHRITRDWGEGNKTGNFGTTATIGEVTWNSAKQSQVAWTSAGGDFVGTVSATSNAAVAATTTSYTWGSTTQMVTDVQGWLDSPSTNFGWLLKNNESADLRTVRRFDTREGGNTAALTITYVSPVYLPIVIK